MCGSILPAADDCTLFSPQRPITHPLILLDQLDQPLSSTYHFGSGCKCIYTVAYIFSQIERIGDGFATFSSLHPPLTQPRRGSPRPYSRRGPCPGSAESPRRPGRETLSLFPGPPSASPTRPTRPSKSPLSYHSVRGPPNFTCYITVQSESVCGPRPAPWP